MAIALVIFPIGLIFLLSAMAIALVIFPIGLIFLLSGLVVNIIQEMAEKQHHVSKKRNHMVSEEEHEIRPLISKRKKDNSSSSSRRRQDEDDTKVGVATTCNVPPADDILFEILLLLPVKSLLRCKSVCKLWLSIVSDPGFVAAHLDRAKRSPKLAVLPLVQSVDRHITVYSYEEGSRRADFLFAKEFNRLQERVVTVRHSDGLETLEELCSFNPSTRLAAPQHSNGLLLLETVAELSVFNPSTRQVVTLPPVDSYALVTNMARGIVERAGFGFDSCSGVYKVARYFNRYRPENPEKIDLGFEVFTLGVDSSWRVIDDAPSAFSTYHSPVSVGGAIYYPIHLTELSLDSLLLRFDLRDEEFTVLPSPPLATPIQYTHFYMAEMEGVLVLSTFQYREERGKQMDTWKLVEGAWVHSCSLGIDLCSRKLRPSDFRPVAVRHGKLLLQIMQDLYEDVLLAFYDPWTKSVEKTVHLAEDLAYYDRNSIPRYFREERCSLFQVVSYVESLVSWETTGHKEKKEN